MKKKNKKAGKPAIKNTVWKVRFLSPDKKQFIGIGHREGCEIIIGVLKNNRYVLLNFKRVRKTEGRLYKK